MNLQDYIRWLQQKYGESNISFTGMPIEEPINPLDELAKLFGEKLGELNLKIERQQEDINIIYGVLNAKKRNKPIRQRNISKGKGKRKV